MKLRELHEAAAGSSNVFTTPEEIVKWLVAHNIHRYNINEDLTVDVFGDVAITAVGLDRLPLKFRKVDGHFTLRRIGKSLEGCPDIVTMSVLITNAGITNLKGGPRQVGSLYIDCCMKLTSTEGAPTKIDSSVMFNECLSLKRIVGLPDPINLDLSFNGCNKLTSLAGCPSRVQGSFNLARCTTLKSIVGCPSFVGNDLMLSACYGLKSLAGFPKRINGNLGLTGTSKLLLRDSYLIINTPEIDEIITSHPLNTPEAQVCKIVAKYLDYPFGNKRWIECQSELIDAGLEEYAGVGDD
jgi:hypothetical protein